jgi:TRAP-type mannitol/chloroaromatic compound transport system permease small subunit
VRSPHNAKFPYFFNFAEIFMQFLLSLSRRIDKFSDWVGHSVRWLVLAAVLISAGNAVIRKAFNMSSNAYLEIQWYLFAAVFLLAAGYTMMRQEHVRIDVISGRFSKRNQIWIDIIGICVFLFPFIFMIIKLSMPLVIGAFVSKEMSSNAGGLIRWPVFALLPLGMLLLGVQGLSELIKRVAFLRGLVPDPTKKQGVKTPEEELAEFLLKKEVAAREAALLGAAK